MFDWRPAAEATAGGVAATVLAWLLGRTDTAKDRRDREVSVIAARVLTDSKISERVAVVESQLADIKEGISEVKATTRDTNDKIDALFTSGQFNRRRRTP